MSFGCPITSIKESGPSSRRRTNGWLLAKLKAIEDANFIYHPFESLDQMIRQLRLPAKKFAQWRMVKCQLGQINGLDRSRGLLVAASGVECLILTSDDCYYIGHKDHWVRELCEAEVVPAKVKQPKRERLFDTF